MKTMSEMNVPKAEVTVHTIQNVENVAIANLLDRVRQLAEQNMRFITATCLDRGDKLEVFYHFDQELRMLHLRFIVGRGEELPSISGLYLCAFLVENEMRELFGLNITGLAIDFRGRMLLTEDSPQLPMLKRRSHAA